MSRAIVAKTAEPRRTVAARRRATNAAVVGLLSDVLAIFKELYSVAPPISSSGTRYNGIKEWAISFSAIAASHAAIFTLMKSLRIEPTDEQIEGGRHIESLIQEIEKPSHMKGTSGPMISDHEARVRAMTNKANGGD